MSTKEGEVLLTKTDIDILDFLINEKEQPVKKCNLYSHFADKGNNRIKDRIENLYNLGIIDEINRDEKKGKKLKIKKPSLTLSLLKNFKPRTR